MSETYNICKTELLNPPHESGDADEYISGAPSIESSLGDRYHILRHLGEGAWGSVYLIEDHKLGKQWALKIVREITGDELTALKRIDHPAFPRIVDVLETESGTGLIMDFISGTTIGEYAASHRISTDMLYEWTLEIAGALRYLHTISPVILYLDCKPSNIIYGEDGHIHLVDLGSAYIPDVSDRHRISGTLPYAAPEQRRGMSVDVRSDIYALGVTVKTIGRLPEQRFTLLSYIRYRHDRDKRFRALSYIIGRCMESRPADRYQTADELIYQLTHPGSIPYRLPSTEKIIQRSADILYKNIVTLFCILSFHMYANNAGPAYLALGSVLFILLITLSLRHGITARSGVWRCYKDVYLRDLSGAALLVLLCTALTLGHGYAAELTDAADSQSGSPVSSEHMPSKHSDSAAKEPPKITIYDSKGVMMLYKGQYTVTDGDSIYLCIPIESLNTPHLPSTIRVE